MVPVGARLAELARLRLQYDESRRSVQVKPVLKCKQSCRLQIINRFDKTTQLRSRTYLFLLSVYMFGSRGMHRGSKFMISCLHIGSSHGMNCGSEHFLSTYWFSRHALWFRTFPVYILVLEACTVVQNLEACTVVQNISCLHIGSHGMNCGSEHFLPTYWLSGHALSFKIHDFLPTYWFSGHALWFKINDFLPTYWFFGQELR